MSSILGELRRFYHRDLFAQILARSAKTGEFNIADVGNESSKRIAASLVEVIGFPTAAKQPSSQASGSLFASLTRDFLSATFEHLRPIRPGKFHFTVSQKKLGITDYDQFAHLLTLHNLLEEHKELRATLGGEYLITPDIVILKHPFEDDDINVSECVVNEDEFVGSLSPLRKRITAKPTLHASVSCKWTMRSDRAQNSRTEALNLIRNRKGQTPRIVAVTFEPLPTRLASLAIGTGDLDCTYHVCLHELQQVIKQLNLEDLDDLLDNLVSGRRLRDISDLPLDLAI